ncbi:fibronectin type III domain-containing protein [Microbacterium sp. 2FI]|uniref:fibronectin type III domain-containing protein n=1 Tax=Microbacterium sp. 2FI TaxID=2502193 RepID=UPI001BB0F2D7|nr:fibronectin type III domain-containing protein [Microbacterium sp. 2FI]
MLPVPARAVFESNLSAPGPTAIPEAPTIVDAGGDGLSVMASWLPADESEAVESYEIVATPVAGTATEACPGPTASVVTTDAQATAAFVTGLCAQVAYTVVITAANALGMSEPSSPSNPAVPVDALAPRLPVFTGALGRPGRVEVSWAAPGYDGGSPLLTYSVTAYDPDGAVAGTVTVGADVTSATIDGITNGVEYSLSLVASNAVGDSPAASTTAIPSAIYPPSAPEGLAIVPDAAGALDVAWKAPSDDGGASITGYTITYQRGEQDSEGVWTPIEGAPVHTLSAGVSDTAVRATEFENPDANYLFTIVATNPAGAGATATSAAGANPHVQVSDATVVLSEGSTTAIAGLTADAISWEVPGPAQVVALRVGDVLVGGASPTLPQGLLRRVETIVTDAGHVIVGTSDAALTDVFDAMSMATDLEATSSEASPGAEPLRGARARIQPMSEGVHTAEPFAVDAGFSGSSRASFAVEKKFGPGFVEGKVSIESSVSLSLGVSASKVTVDAMAATRTSVEFNLGLKGEKSWEIAELRGVPSTFFIGLVPVVVQPKVPIFVTVSGEVSVGVHATSAFGAGLSWDSSEPGQLRVIDKNEPLTAKGGPLPGFALSGKGSVGVRAIAIASLYSLGGPSLSFEARLEAEIDFLPPPGEPFLTIGPVIEVKAGLAFHAFGVHGAVEASIAVKRFLKFTIDAPPSASYSITPTSAEVPAGTPLQLTAKRSDGEDAAKTWGVRGGVAGDSVSPTGVFVPAQPGGRNVTITVGDSTGATGTINVFVGKSFGGPRALTVTRASEGIGMNVSWSEPASMGDGVLTGYVVRTTPSTGAHDLSAGETSFSLTDLSPGRYSVSVYAKNSAGQISAAAVREITLYPQCSLAFDGAVNAAWNVAANWSEDRLPGTGDWVCLGGHAVTIPGGTTARVSGLLTGGGTITLDGTLVANTYFESSGSIGGAGTFEAGSTVRWALSGNVSVDVINRGELTIDGGLALHGASITNYGSLQVEPSGWGQARIHVGSGTTAIVNKIGATFTAATPETGSQVYIEPAVTNEGTITSTSAQWNRVTNNGRFAVTAESVENIPTYVATFAVESGTISGAGVLQFADVVVPSSGKSLTARSGHYVFGGGVVSGGVLTFGEGAVVDFAEYGSTTLQASVVNRGAVTVEHFVYFSDASFTNFGTVEVRDDVEDGWYQAALLNGSGTNQFVNKAGGILSVVDDRDDGAALVWIDVPVVNEGTLSSASGRWGDVINRGTFELVADVAAGQPSDVARLQVSSGSVTGAGTLRAGDVVVPSGGYTLPGRSGHYVFGGGVVSGGVLTFGEGAVVDFAEYGSTTLQASVVNRGAVTVEHFVYFSDASFTNFGTVEVRDDVEDGWYQAALLNGSGTNQFVNKAGGILSVVDDRDDDAALVWIDVPVVNEGTLSSASGRWGDVINRGTFELVPGEGSTVTTRVERLTLDHSSVLRAPITRADGIATAAAALVLQSAIDLGGVLELVSVGAFTAEDSDVVELITAVEGVSGGFSAITSHIPGPAWTATRMADRLFVATGEFSIINIEPPSVGMESARVGEPLVAQPGVWSIDPAEYEFQWLRDGAVITGATGPAYTPTASDAGKQISVLVKATVEGVGSSDATSAAVTVAAGTLTLTPTPTISGTAKVGLKLTASAGTWGPATVTLKYQWRRDGTAITGATGSTYVLGAADKGRQVTVTVTGSKSGYTSVSKTSAAKTVLAGTLTLTPTPTISGTAKVGLRLTASAGTWAPATVTLKYQWRRGGAAITGATASTYVLVAADKGSQITVTVTGSKSGYTSVSKTSAAKTVLAGTLTLTPTPTISGTAKVGLKLTASAGTWGPATVTLKYQWRRDGTAITGATGSTYVLGAADKGRQVTVTVTGSKSGYTSVSKTSAAKTVLAGTLTLTPTPTISGTAKVGLRLTASAGTWAPATVTLKYQWRRGGAAITGATASTYVLVAADKGSQITVTVTGSKSGYTSVSKTSAAKTVAG